MKDYIDRSVWINYFNEFTRRNRSRSTLLEVFGENGAQQQARGLPFAGISLGKGNGAPEIEIMLGEHDTRAQRLTHVITKVEQITPKHGQDGRDEVLQIVSAGETCLLTLDPRPAIGAGR